VPAPRLRGLEVTLAARAAAATAGEGAPNRPAEGGRFGGESNVKELDELGEEFGEDELLQCPPEPTDVEAAESGLRSCGGPLDGFLSDPLLGLKCSMPTLGERLAPSITEAGRAAVTEAGRTSGRTCEGWPSARPTLTEARRDIGRRREPECALLRCAPCQGGGHHYRQAHMCAR